MPISPSSAAAAPDYLHLPDAFASIRRAFHEYGDAIADRVDRHLPYAAAVYDRRADVVREALRAIRASDTGARAIVPIVVAAAVSVRPEVLSFTADGVEFDASWDDHGRPVFVPSASLLAQLALTDCGKIAELDVAWPFPAFRIVLPQPEPRIAFVDADERPCVARHIDIVRWAAPMGAAVLNEDNAAGQSIRSMLDIVRADLSQHETPHAQGICARVYGERDFSIYQNAPWTGETDVADWIGFRGEGEAHPAMRADYEMLTEDRRALAICQRIAVNLALYLSSERENGQKIWTPAAKTSGRPGRWQIGSEVRIGPEVRRAASEVAAGRPATAPSIRHVVRGHFRNQACGPQRSQRRRIYVAPHWRGEGEGGTERRYRVE